MRWQDFERGDRDLARIALERMEKVGFVFLGTLRRDGSPRISPIETLVESGELYAGMIWHSKKALDLLRDSRYTLHTWVGDRMGTGGEVKLYGRANRVDDLAERSRYADALFAKIGWKPEEPRWHLFSFDVESAGYTTVEGERRVVRTWSQDAGSRRYETDPL
jgi:hypothetical protein